MNDTLIHVKYRDESYYVCSHKVDKGCLVLCKRFDCNQLTQSKNGECMTNGMFAGLIDLAGSKMPVLQSTVNHYTDLFLKYEDELTEDECDAIDALLRIIEERVVDETKDYARSSRPTRIAKMTGCAARCTMTDF